MRAENAGRSRRLLESIDGPSALRRLTPSELSQVATEIREFIVQSVCVQGGHLGSNLGVVELTLALHRVFDSPKDIILWDTGHQAYVHKIVTGRRAAFVGLRQRGGLSGYPSRAESEHDWVENSHASTILSYSHGLATALAMRGEQSRRVIAVVGDGALTGGMAYEALNNLGHSQRRVLILLNDNGRSYAPTVGLLAGLTRLRMNPAYVKNRVRVQRVLRHLPVIGEYLDLGIEGMRAAVREAVISPNSSEEALDVGAPIPEAVLHPGYFFEALGVRYIGPVDGHDVANLERTLSLAAEYDGPVVVHALTQKGRGYGPAEGDGEKCLHDAPVFDPVAGPPPWQPAGYTKVFADAMVHAGERDPRVVAITAAMAGPTGLRPFQERWPDRVVDVGIAEQHAVTAAAGVAMGGLRPVVAIYSSFLTRALDQINLDVGLHRLPVVFCIDRAGVTGEDGPSHHGLLDIALLLQVPGMTILTPSSADDLRAMLELALGLDGPVAIRYPKGVARSVPPVDPTLGLRAHRIRAGSDVCILAVGKLVEAADEAARLLAQHGVHPTVWDVRVVKPLDQTMLASAATHHLVVTAEDGVRRGGAGSAIAGALADYAKQLGTAPPAVVSLGLPDAYIPQGRPDAILAEAGLDGPGLAACVVGAIDADQMVTRR
jgi:1-deoxy-D-xylulose-5-phosphate synthase